MTEQTKPGEFERLTAERVTPDPIDPRVREMEVIDTDFHFGPSWDMLLRYMAEPYKSRMWSFPATSTEINPECANGKPGVGQNTFGQASTAEDALKICDENGVNTVVLNPGFPRAQSIFNEPVVAAVASAYNDHMINEVFPKSDRIYASMMLCHRDPEMGAREIRRVGGHPQFVSFFTEFGGCYESLGNAKYDPIFDAANDVGGLAMTAHTGGFMPHFSPAMRAARTWVELFGNMTSATCITHVAAYIMQGLFDKYPDQKILLQEGGFWWIPDISARLDDFYISHPGDIAMVERKVESGERFLNKLPSEYFLSNIRFSTQPMTVPGSRRDWADLLRMCHAKDIFCFSSDWPHQTFDAANWVVENPDIIDAEMASAILSGNARKLFPKIK